MSTQPDPSVVSVSSPGAPPATEGVSDLTPEQLAALDLAMEAGAAQGLPAATAAEPGEAPSAAPDTAAGSLAADFAAGEAESGLPLAGAPASGTPSVAAVVTTDTTAGADGSGSVTRTAVAAAVSPVAGAIAAGIQLSENVGLATTTYQREMALPSDRALVRLLVPESRTLSVWNTIDELEAEVVNLHRGSQVMVAEMIDRLTVARNMLLHSRDTYEDAAREVAIVRHRLLRVQKSAFLEQPQTIVGYLVLMLLLLGAGFAASNAILNMLGRPGTIAGITAPTLLNTMLWGGIGGLTAAFLALLRHVLDFDQQHARWYYLGPVVGLFIGPLIALVAEIGVPALFVLAGGQTANMTVAPALLYLLAWAVGFQQNLLLRLVNKVFTSIFPDRSAAG